MATPKRRTSRSKRDMRRSQTFTTTTPGITECPQCHEMKLSHRVCKTCGYYNGKEVISSDME
ncbi:MAG: 50S ribosomal protein L32 [Clostridium sp.]|nr:50S ribosomal protein L32 [Clostridium sp.]